MEFLVFLCFLCEVIDRKKETYYCCSNFFFFEKFILTKLENKTVPFYLF